MIMRLCPVCRRAASEATGPCRETGETDLLIGYHSEPGGRQCWAVGYSWEAVRAMARILKEGGDRFRLAAHP